MEYKELEELVKAEKVEYIIMADGTKARLFISNMDRLCRFKPKSSRRGYVLSEVDVNTLQAIVYLKEKTQEDLDKDEFKLISKYRKLAEKSSFTNPFIEDCRFLPATLEEWVKQGKKSLYDYRITTGNRIDGKVITLDKIFRLYPEAVNSFRDAIRKKRESRHSGPMDGYDMTISTQKRGDGTFVGYLAMEFKGCANGYYYALINDNTFIGVDVD